MFGQKSVLFLLGGVCLVQPHASWADTIPALPLASVYQSVSLPTGQGDGGFANSFGSFQLNYAGDSTAGAMSAATSAYGGGDPGVTAAASFSSTPGPYNGTIEADSELIYHFEVVGPSGSPVPVHLVASGRANTADTAVPLYAELTISGNGEYFEIAACGNPSTFVFCSAGPNSQQFDVDTILYLTPNLDYQVTMEANIEAGLFYGPLPSGAFSANAYVDPTLRLDAGVGDRYSIVTSANLAATPEPESLILTVTGALILGASMYGSKTRFKPLRPLSYVELRDESYDE